MTKATETFEKSVVAAKVKGNVKARPLEVKDVLPDPSVITQRFTTLFSLKTERLFWRLLRQIETQRRKS